MYKVLKKTENKGLSDSFDNRIFKIETIFWIIYNIRFNESNARLVDLKITIS